MAFSHFHRHSKKYLAFFVVTTLFSLFTFNITSGILSFFSGMGGGTAGAYLRFDTSTGQQVGINRNDWAVVSAEIRGLALLYRNEMGRQLYEGVEPDQAPVAHAILMAEADAMKLEVPPDAAEREFEQFKFLLQFRYRQKALTYADLHAVLRGYGLTEESFHRRMAEVLRVQAYIRSMTGLSVQNPEEIYKLFAVSNELVSLDYVVVPWDKFKEELKQSPPSDADLETYYKTFPPAIVRTKFTRAALYTLDFAIFDGDAWDPATADAAIVGGVADPTHDEVLSECKRDARRYTADGKAPEKVADVSPETRARIKKDRQLKAVVDKARADYEAALNALPALDASKSDDEKKAALEERRAKEKAAFDEMATKYGFAAKRVTDQEEGKIGEIDPPKDLQLQFMARGLAEPGGAGQKVHELLPAGIMKYAYLVRLDQRKASETKPLAEVKEEVLDRWADEKSKEKALATASAFCADLVAEAKKGLPAERLAELEKARDKELADVDGNARLDAEEKRRRRDVLEKKWYLHLASAIGPVIGEQFAPLAQKQGLEVKKVGPERRSVSDAPYFHERFSGVERFLLAQDGSFNAKDGRLLGYATGMVSEPLVDDEDKSCVIAKIAAREQPKIDAMTPHDRDLAERQASDAAEGRQQIPLLNPFSMVALARRHHPKVMTQKAEGQPSAPAPYGY